MLLLLIMFSTGMGFYNEDRLHRDFLTDRINQLKDNYLKVKPSISIVRAQAFTEVTRKNPDLPVNIRRAMGFKRACEIAPCTFKKVN